MRYVATIEGTEHEIEIEELAPESFAIQLGETRFEADLRRVGPQSFSVLLGRRSFDFDVVRDGDEIVVSSRHGSTRLSVVGAARRAARASARKRDHAGPAQIRAQMPGRIVNVLVAAGDQVKSGQGILIIEAMKLENEMKSPKDGKVVEVNVAAGQTVEKGTLMIVIE
jgi:biotin carboxyl carrier protein